MPNQYPQIVLASASPRRRELLASVGIEFQVIPSHIDEIQQADEKPEAFVLRLSQEKAAEVAQRSTISGRWFIGSDTIVLCAIKLSLAMRSSIATPTSGSAVVSSPMSPSEH